MKKWLLILTLALLLTGCDKKQETDEKEESPKASVEMSVEQSEPEATEETAESVEESTEPAEESTEVVENEVSEFYFPMSDSEEISEEILAGMSAGNLWVAKNEIYARHGRIFEDPVLNAYFLGCSWYVPEIQPEDFDETVLNPIERNNIQRMQTAEVQATGEIPMSDRLAVVGNSEPYTGFFAYIEDGDVYFYCEERYGFISTLAEEKFSGLSPIRRIKTYRRAPGEVPSPCLITESGEVYWLNITYAESEKMTIERFEALADYQVEDILYYIGGEKSYVRVLLKDGNMISLEGEGWNLGNQIREITSEEVSNSEGNQKEIPTSDLFVLKCESGDLFYAYIDDGFLYYYHMDDSFMYTESDKVRPMVKFEGLNHIKRMKYYNVGSGVDRYPCLITEEGEVYWLNNTYMSDRQEICIERFEFLKDYQVEDILYFHCEWAYEVEVLLKDGQILYLESEPWG